MKGSCLRPYLLTTSLLFLLSFATACACEASNKPATQAASTAQGTSPAPVISQGTGEQTTPLATTGAAQVPVPVVFVDPVFEKLIKAELKKDSILPVDLDQFTGIIIGGDHFISLSGPSIPEKSIILYYGTEVEYEGVRYQGFGTMKSLADLVHFKNLTVLNVTLQPQIDYTTVPKAITAQLQRVFLTQSQLTEINFLKDAGAMFNLSLSSNQIEDLSPLSSCSELIYLSGHSNLIQDLSPLAGLTKLKTLGFYENQIKDLSPLGNLANLTTLELYENDVEDITILANLKNLKKLELINNKVKDVTPLKGFTSFESLRLRGNPIENIEELDHIENLEFE